jgi:hypothetical protein
MPRNATRTAEVIGFETYKLARRAAAALRGLLHEPDWLIDVRVVVLASGESELVVEVAAMRKHILMCLPRSVDDIPVRVRSATSLRDRGEPTR